jgi:hypothetical protein
MKVKEAVHILQVLLSRDADCRCGNFTLEDEDRKAIETVLDVLPDLESNASQEAKCSTTPSSTQPSEKD